MKTHTYYDPLTQKMKSIPAMEADDDNVPDLTKTTETMMKTVGAPPESQMEPATTSEETRKADGGEVDRNALSTRTDNLLNTPNPENPPDPLDGEGENTPPDEGAGEDTGMEDIDNSLGEPAEQLSPQQKRSIGDLRKNMDHFYQNLANSIETLSNYSPPASSEELRKIYNHSVSHLNDAKELLHEMLTQEMTPENYPEMLRKYISLRHVYSIVLEMMKLHFDALNVEVGLNA